jgi:hypothetical protein
MRADPQNLPAGITKVVALGRIRGLWRTGLEHGARGAGRNLRLRPGARDHRLHDRVRGSPGSLSFEERFGLLVDQHWNMAWESGDGPAAEEIQG